MSDEEASEMYNGKKYGDVIRGNGRGWTPDKYARMGIYVYLYNRVKGRPTNFDLSNNDVTFRIRDYIRDHLDELLERYGVKNGIPGVDFSSPEAQKQFLDELDDYNEHALEINSNMPSIKEMNYFLEEVASDRSSHFEAIRKSVKWKSGEYYDAESGKDKNGRLYAERLEKRRQIKEQKRRIRRESFWGIFKGVGAVASAGLVVASGLAMLAPAVLGLGPVFAASFVARGIIGLAGIALGGAAFSGFGGSFISSLGKIFTMRRKLRDLKYQEGKDRGLKNIEKQIKINEQIKDIYNVYGKINKDGRQPTFKEFESYVRRHYRAACRSGMFDMKQLYADAGFRYSAEKGNMRKVMRFIGHNEVSEIKNEEIPIERDDKYNKMFNKGTGKDAETGELLSMEDMRRGLTELSLDKSLYENKNMGREYSQLELDASEALLNVYSNDIFEQPYSGNKANANAAYLNNKIISEKLENHPEGDKTGYVKNAIAFVNSEARYASPDEKLDSSLKVSVRDQLTRNSEDMNHACKVLGVDETSAEYSVVQDITGDIESMTNKADAVTLHSRINALSISSEAKRYLNIMVDHREKESRVTDEEIVNAMGYTSPDEIPDDLDGRKKEIFEAISSLSGTNSIEDIKKLIYSEAYLGPSGEFVSKERYESIARSPEFAKLYKLQPIFSGEEQKRLIEILTRQADSIEMRRKSEIRAKAVESVKQGNYVGNLEEVMGKIQGITYSSLSDESKLSDTNDLYRNEVNKATPPEMRDYLLMRLKQRTEEAFLSEINRPGAYKPKGGSDVLEKLSKDLILITDCKFLDPAQKERLITKIEDRMEDAFELPLKTMGKDLLKDIKGAREKIELYLNRPYSAGGFKDLLNRPCGKNSSLLKIKNQFNRLSEVIQISENLIATAEGVGQVVDPDTADTRVILKILTNPDHMSESLVGTSFLAEIRKIAQINSIKGLNGLASNGKAKVTTPDGRVQDTKDTVIDEMQAELTRIKGMPLKNDQKLALLLLLKKNAMTALKAHLNKFIVQPNKADVINHIAAHRSDLDGIERVWSELCKELDNEIDKYCNPDPSSPDYSEDHKKYEDVKYAIGNMNIVGASKTLHAAVSSNDIISFTASKSAEIGREM